MITILIKELNEFLNSLIAYVVVGIFLIAIGLLMWVFPDTNVLDYGYASLETLFSIGPYVLMFLVPAITMKSFAEEKRNGTIELLFTLPFSVSDIVLGKFLAGFLLVFFSILPTVVYYFSISYLGNPVANLDTAGILGSYVGLVLLGGLFAAIGIFSSTLTGNQIVSFMLASFLCFAFYSGFESIASINQWSSLSYFIRKMGVVFHYDILSRGLIDISDVIYFLSMIALFLFFTITVIQTQKK